MTTMIVHICHKHIYINTGINQSAMFNAPTSTLNSCIDVNMMHTGFKQNTLTI